MLALRQRFRAWLFRPRVESGTVTLNQRRIFILPTRQGAGFAAVLLLMLLGDINYNLSLGYLFTFLLGSMGVMSMLYAFRNMARLEIRAGRADAAFAGDLAQFVVHFHNDGGLPRHRLYLRDDGGHAVAFDLLPRQSAAIRLGIPAGRRGWLEAGRLTLHTEFPLGLFHAWSYLHFDMRCLVYPRPSGPVPLPAFAPEDGTGTTLAAGDGDFAGLRGYVAGDAVQRIAWKAAARGQALQVKHFQAPQGNRLWLDWNLAPAGDVERRLGILTRWVLEAEAQEIRYGLRLPGIELPPEHGPAHRDACLRALALFGMQP